MLDISDGEGQRGQSEPQPLHVLHYDGVMEPLCLQVMPGHMTSL